MGQELEIFQLGLNISHPIIVLLIEINLLLIHFLIKIIEPLDVFFLLYLALLYLLHYCIELSKMFKNPC